MTEIKFTRETAPKDWQFYAEWSQISTENLEEKVKIHLSRLQAAVISYINGEQHDVANEQHGIYRQTILRAFRRCIACDDAGHQLGWQGLLPRLRIHSPIRRAPLIPSGRNLRGGLSGALCMFLRTRVAIAADFTDYLLNTAKRVLGHEAKLRQKSAHQKFIELCHEHGVSQSEWPLCTVRQGIEAVRRYVIDFLERRYDDVVATQWGARAKARSRTGTGHSGRLRATRPFDVVEIDEHKCGFIGSIGIESPEGMRWLPVQRVTLILAVDRALRLILGYKVIFRREANADDVLDALNSAVGNAAPRVDCDGVEIEAASGLPCELGEPFTWCGFNQVLFDNALIHIATEISDRARAILGCDLNLGPIRRFERRPTAENVFGGIERRGFSRIASTVGSSPQDPDRQKPEEEAIKARLTAREIVGLVEDVIADHNRQVTKSNFGASPLGRLQASLDDVDGFGTIFPVLPPLAFGVAGLDVSVVELTIRGGKADGRRPYFTFEEEAYTGKTLARSWPSIGEKVYGHVRRDDIRTIELFSTSGVHLETATVTGRWRHTRHSRETRRHINALIHAGYLAVPYDQCPVHRFVEAIKQSVQANRKGSGSFELSRKDLGVLAEEQERDNPSTFHASGAMPVAPMFDRSPGAADEVALDPLALGHATPESTAGESDLAEDYLNCDDLVALVKELA